MGTVGAMGRARTLCWLAAAAALAEPCSSGMTREEALGIDPGAGTVHEAPPSWDPEAIVKRAAPLLAFKASGNGAGLDSWREGGDPCKDGWEGIICDEDDTKVIRVDLRGNSDGSPFRELTGDIKPFGELPLNYLGMAGTKVSGHLKDLREIRRLSSLNLAATLVEGEVKYLNVHSRLSYLALYETKVSGSLSDIGTLLDLQYLYLDETGVAGDVGELAELRLEGDDCLWLSTGDDVTGWPLHTSNGCFFDDASDHKC